MFLIQQTTSVYIDNNTLEYLKTGKIIGFPDFSLFENYTRQLWFQLINWMKFECDNCGEVYWVDDSKVSPQGAKTKCVKCQHVITVQQREKPTVLQEKIKRKTVSCPHCQYENTEGAQFCVMCQQPLVDFAEKAKKKSPARESAQEQEPPGPQKETSDSAPQPVKATAEAPDLNLDDIPLQARMRPAPNRSFQELANSLQDDMRTLDNKFSWYTSFALFMKVLGFLALSGGVLAAGYIFFVIPPPATAEMMTDAERVRYTIAAIAAGGLTSLICFIVSNIIALNLEIERNTKFTFLLLQRLISKLE